jgi:tRNA threonylcarbamoyladenosine biosynthesis protein TsaB
MRILAIDTATESCSAALLVGATLLMREIETGRGHAEHILPMVDAVLSEAGLALGKLDAIAFGRGPGGFTGVRLAASVAQGLAFGAQLPVVPISNLRATAQRALDLDGATQRVLVCNDARMQEVYWGCFERAADGLASLIGSEHVGPASSVQLPVGKGIACTGAGRGFRVYPDLGKLVERTFSDLLPRAGEIARLAADAPRVSPEEAIPVYLRDDVARAPS